MPDHAQLPWKKSSFSGGGDNCVEVALLASGGAFVRDTKNRHAATLAFTPGEWAAFIAGAQAGEFGPGVTA